MNFNGLGSYEDLLRACGYSSSSDNGDNLGCNDIPNGFQTLHPEIFVLIGELLGNIIAGKIPFNVQNSIGNWLQLVGQAILTFNAQQQYLQSGPGRYYDIKNYNIVNPFCRSDPSYPSANTSSTSKHSNTSTSSKSSSSNYNNININKLEKLETQVEELTNEINKIKVLLQNNTS